MSRTQDKRQQDKKCITFKKIRDRIIPGFHQFFLVFIAAAFFVVIFFLETLADTPFSMKHCPEMVSLLVMKTCIATKQTSFQEKWEERR